MNNINLSIIKCVGLLNWPHEYALADYKVPATHALLLTKTNWCASNLGIAGEYKHAALLIDGWVIEAVTHGVRCVPIHVFMKNKDHIMVLESPLLKKIDYSTITNMFVGKGYDGCFAKDNNTYYCFELIAAILEINLGLKLPTYTSFFGKELYLDKSFIDASIFNIIDQR